MQYGDYRPPTRPSFEQQQDALQKGLGRAMQWAMTGQLGDDPLLAACLRDQRFDTQVEGSRGDWLWRMIRAIGATERFRVPQNRTDRVLDPRVDDVDRPRNKRFAAIVRHSDQCDQA